ncbi:hypothetical protein AAFF_G00373160 [Aldrovandia affinis]|uniref:Uncharacterized protein n=1 Tax=Aldrovandia affinis TaxID=143900 RepID=A0AAD7SIH6_9TELE|nr:hypothetical protein AAFF_G00373160 [Aldrovandia affinis]
MAGVCVYGIKTAASENGLDIDLTNKTLQLIPPDLPSNITKLILSHNLIQMSVADVAALERYTELTELRLDSNNITALPGHIFGSLSKLRILSVSHNSIGRVDPGAFTALGNLKKLDLSHNPLQSLPLGVFSSLSSLGSLSLQDSGLHSLENDTFTDLVKRTLVQLGGNPWNCSCAFLHQIKYSGVEISKKFAS